MGCSVLLSDVDVLWAQNPFTLPSLYRDSDVEGMSDGWDERTALATAGATTGAAASLRPRRATAASSSSAPRGGAPDDGAAQGADGAREFGIRRPTTRSSGTLPSTARQRTGSTRVMRYYCHMNSGLPVHAIRFRALRPPPRSSTSTTTPRSCRAEARAVPRRPARGVAGRAGRTPPRPTAAHAWHWGVGLLKGKWCRGAAPPRGQGLEGQLAQKLVQATQGSKVIKWAGQGSVARAARRTPWAAARGGWRSSARAAPSCTPTLWASSTSWPTPLAKVRSRAARMENDDHRRR